jgi:hypothetical protein
LRRAERTVTLRLVTRARPAVPLLLSILLLAAVVAVSARADVRTWPRCESAVAGAQIRAAIGHQTYVLGLFNPNGGVESSDIFGCTAFSNRAEAGVEIFCRIPHVAAKFPALPKTFFYTGVYKSATPVRPLAGIGEQAIFMTDANIREVKSKEAAVATYRGTMLVIASGARGRNLLSNTAVPAVPLPLAPLAQIAKAALRFNCKRPA